MKRTLLVALLPAIAAHAAVVSESWGPKGQGVTHPGAMEVDSAGAVPRLVYDLSAIPRGAKVHHASLRFPPGQGQPREPAKLRVVDRLDGGKAVPAGGPLKLEAPLYRSYDATAAVQRWVKDPSGNRGIAVDGLDPRGVRLDVRYEGKASKLPPQVEALKVVRRNGQTVLVFRELPEFRPRGDEVFYIQAWRGAQTALVDKPGTDEMGNPTQPAIKLATLRRLQGLKVRTTPGRGQEDPPHVRVREVPNVRYRVYRSRSRITPATIGSAQLVGEAAPLCGYDHKMNIIFFSGEYYQKHERPDTVISTFCVADLKALTPGEAYYVHTPAEAGKSYYAVTAMMNGRENLARITSANSLAQPVDEKPAAPSPVKYFVTRSTIRGPRHDKTTEYWFLYWHAPPFSNVPMQLPRRIVAAVPDNFTPPGPMLIDMRGSVGREGSQADTSGTLSLRTEVAGSLAYNSGRGTLRSYRESKVETFTERYVFHVVDWARKQWKIDPARISGTKGMSIHLAIRHPEVFGVFWPDRPEFYSNDFDSKWNPRGWLLGREIGPYDLVRAPTAPGWDIYNIRWYLSQDPAKDIPFMGCLFSQPKDGNHGAEYGWQDDPKGWAALRDFRQPYVAQWGGGGVSREVRAGLYALRWDKSVPAFSHCTLDNNPGTGDPDAGEPWGQVNGYLFWDYDSIVDEKGRWEMTVYLVPSCPDAACTVDLTPRHCKAFKPKGRQKLKWTNTALDGGGAAGSGTVEADKWGLVTLKQVTVTKGKNRIVIRKK